MLDDNRAPETQAAPPGKFQDPERTADGSERAWVNLDRLDTLWFNTGSRCNIECRHCYAGSGPADDRLEFMTRAEVARYLDEAETAGRRPREVGFTGGEPFVNPEAPGMIEEALERGLEALVLTNAMRPMMRPAVREHLLRLRRRHGDRLGLRISLDHHTPDRHESERGPGSWAAAWRGTRWLAANGFRLSVAGRTRWQGTAEEARAGYARLFAAERLDLDAHDPASLTLFPELGPELDVPEITVDCWRAVGVEPSAMMCASARMVLRRKGAPGPVVVACTLLPFDPRFELGPTLQSASRPVRLNHPYCARFCVLGGGSCSGASAGGPRSRSRGR